MDVKTYLKGELDKHVAQAKTLTDAATEDGRSLTDDERDQVAMHVKAAGEFKSKLTDMTANDELRESIDKLGASVVTPGSGKVEQTPSKSIGAAFINSPQFKALRERGTDGSWSTGAISLDYIGAKANETVISTNTDLVPAEYVPGVVDIAKQPLTLMNAIPQATTNS